MQNFAVLVDLNAIRLNIKTFEDTLAVLAKNYAVSYYKFYNYDNKRNREFYKFIAGKNAETALPLHNRRKVTIDTRQVIDATKLACRSDCDGVFLICAEVDSLPLITAIKGMGKKVVLGVLSQSCITQQASDCILINRVVEDSDTIDDCAVQFSKKSNVLAMQSSASMPDMPLFLGVNAASAVSEEGLTAEVFVKECKKEGADNHKENALRKIEQSMQSLLSGKTEGRLERLRRLQQLLECNDTEAVSKMLLELQ